MAIQIKKAVRERVFLKIAVGGPTGSGKTWGAIGVAKGLAPSGKVLVLDTENRSASYYAGPTDTAGAWDFDVVEIEAPFTPQKYLEGLRAAIDNGYEAVAIDSLTHEWNASGGILDQKSQKDARGGNSFTNWNDMKQIHNKFVETLLQSKIHVVCTLRSKMEYVMEEGANKKIEVKKIGLAPISSDGMEYEFGVFFDVDRSNHLAVATKDRTSLFEGRSVLLGDEIGKELRAWRDSGAELKPEPTKAVEQGVAKAPVDPTSATPGPAGPAAPSSPAVADPRAVGLAAPAETIGDVAANVAQAVKDNPQEISPEVNDFVDGLTPIDQISEVQYEALAIMVDVNKLDRDRLRAYCAKAGHLLPGKNGPTLRRMKVEAFEKLRDRLCDPKRSARTVEIINETPLTPYQPTALAS